MFSRKQLMSVLIKNLLKSGGALLITIIIVIVSVFQISNIKNTIREKQKIAFTLERKSDTVSNIKADFARVGSGEKRMLDAAPLVDNISGFIGTLEGLAGTGIGSQGIRFGTPTIITED